MATTITGHDVTLVIDGDNFHPQVTSATLSVEDSQETFDVLGARVYKTVRDASAGVPYMLEITMLADQGIKRATDLSRIASDFGHAFLLMIQLFKRHHGEKDIVLFKSKERAWIVQQDIGVEHEKFA
jgi:hypothetical protein